MAPPCEATQTVKPPSLPCQLDILPTILAPKQNPEMLVWWKFKTRVNGDDHLSTKSFKANIVGLKS
jgi:hypothetical protein